MSVAGLGNSSVITRMRRGVSQDVLVDLIRAPDVPSRNALVLGEDAVLAGLALARINPAVIDALNLPLIAKGVVVTNTGPLAARVGVRRGDVIAAINDDVIADPKDVALALRGARRWVRLDVLRGSGRVQLRFRL
jgi:S1-C subfamily serine protease